MKIKIEISKREALHLRSPHTFYDSCKEADDVLRKVQKEVDKITPKSDFSRTKKGKESKKAIESLFKKPKKKKQ